MRASVIFFCLLQAVSAWAWEFKPEGSVEACEYNLLEVTKALRAYREDHDGHCPPQLSQLVPRYIASIPKCPEAGHDTYSASYRISKDAHEYSLGCQGYYHDLYGLAPNNPRWDQQFYFDKAVRKRSLKVQFAEESSAGPLTFEMPGGWNLVKKIPTGVLIAPDDPDVEITLGTQMRSGTIQSEVDERKDSHSDVRPYHCGPLTGLTGNLQGNRSLLSFLENKPLFTRFVLAEAGKSRYLLILICKTEAQRQRYTADFDRIVLSIQK
ncbi:MAG: hypothetical protein U0931_31840 [Vulcanimicrobiota bacterium]